MTEEMYKYRRPLNGRNSLTVTHMDFVPGDGAEQMKEHLQHYRDEVAKAADEITRWAYEMAESFRCSFNVDIDMDRVAFCVRDTFKEELLDVVDADLESREVETN